MAQPKLQNTQIDTGTKIGDIIEVVDLGGSTPGLPSIDGSQIINLSSSNLTQNGATDGQVLAWNNTAGEWQPAADTDTRTDISDGGTMVLSAVSDINFNSYLNVTDDTDGTVTVDVPVTGDDANVVTGTAGTTGNVLEWDATGNASDSGQSSADIGKDLQLWSLITSTTTATHSDKLLADTSGGAFTVTLPATPSTGQFVLISDATGTWQTNNLTIDGNGNNVEGSASFNAATNDSAYYVIYNGTQWILRFGP